MPYEQLSKFGLQITSTRMKIPTLQIHSSVKSRCCHQELWQHQEREMKPVLRSEPVCMCSVHVQCTCAVYMCSVHRTSVQLERSCSEALHKLALGLLRQLKQQRRTAWSSWHASSSSHQDSSSNSQIHLYVLALNRAFKVDCTLGHAQQCFRTLAIMS